MNEKQIFDEFLNDVLTVFPSDIKKSISDAFFLPEPVSTESPDTEESQS